MKRPAAVCVIVLFIASPVTPSTVAQAEIRSAYRGTSVSRATSTAARRPWPGDQHAYSRIIAEAAAEHAVPKRLIWAVIRVESGFDHRAVSRSGARGLMQLMPETAAILGVRDSFDPRENIHAGTRHLRAMMERFPRDLRLALAAYNAGEQAVLAFGGVPPYQETREYVRRVLSFYRSAREPEPEPPSGSGFHRIVGRDGTITYTNMPSTRLSAVAGSR